MADDPKLRVVPGFSDVEAPENDPAQPSIVWARNRAKKLVQLCADPSTVRRLEDGGLNAKIGEYVGLVHGRVQGGTKGLIAAHALFAGLERPCLQPGGDRQVITYVLRPDCTFIYPANAKHTGKGPTKMPAPAKSVFVVYAKEEQTRYLSPSGQYQADVAGGILFWEWVLAGSDASDLPDGSEDRYAERIW